MKKNISGLSSTANLEQYTFNFLKDWFLWNGECKSWKLHDLEKRNCTLVNIIWFPFLTFWNNTTHPIIHQNETLLHASGTPFNPNNANSVWIKFELKCLIRTDKKLKAVTESKPLHCFKAHEKRKNIQHKSK